MDYYLAFQIAGLLLALGAVVQIMKPWRIK
jgi:NADH:ubiquinone oxidoreductase subunit 6 (subunit J)